MFRFTQKPSSGSSPLLSYTARLHNRLICRHNIGHVTNDEHNRTIFVVVAKHRTAP